MRETIYDTVPLKGYDIFGVEAQSAVIEYLSIKFEDNLREAFGYSQGVIKKLFEVEDQMVLYLQSEYPVEFASEDELKRLTKGWQE